MTPRVKAAHQARRGENQRKSLARHLARLRISPHQGVGHAASGLNFGQHFAPTVTNQLRRRRRASPRPLGRADSRAICRLGSRAGLRSGSSSCGSSPCGRARRRRAGSCAGSARTSRNAGRARNTARNTRGRRGAGRHRHIHANASPDARPTWSLSKHRNCHICALQSSPRRLTARTLRGAPRTHRGAPGAILTLCPNHTLRAATRQGARRRRRLGQTHHQQAGHQQLKLQTRASSPHHGAQGSSTHIRTARQLSSAQSARLHLHPLQLIHRQRTQSRLRLIPGHSQNQQVTQTLQQILHKPARIVTRGNHTLHHLKAGGAVAGSNRIHALIKQRNVSEPQQTNGLLIINFAVRATN